jgi:hypothetical protein
MHRIGTKWQRWAMAAMVLGALGCDENTVSSCSLALQTVTCQTPQECVDAVAACGPNAKPKLADYVCLRPTPSAVQGSCDTVQRLGPCPEQGCGCLACVKRVDLLCSNCGVVSTCLASSYCTELEPGDCDPPTTPIEVCRPVVVEDGYAGD